MFLVFFCIFSWQGELPFLTKANRINSRLEFAEDVIGEFYYLFIYFSVIGEFEGTKIGIQNETEGNWSKKKEETHSVTLKQTDIWIESPKRGGRNTWRNTNWKFSNLMTTINKPTHPRCSTSSKHKKPEYILMKLLKISAKEKIFLINLFIWHLGLSPGLHAC